MITLDETYYAHPLLQPYGLHLETPAIQAMTELLNRWLWTGGTGGCLIGEARIGKSTAIRSMAGQLKTRAGARVPCHYVSMPDRGQKNDKTIYRRLCWGAGFTGSNNEAVDILEDRIVHYIADASLAVSCPYAVLFIDEMQRMVPRQFNVFADIYDALEVAPHPIKLMCVFIGNTQESSPLLKGIKSDDWAHIRGRFFTQSAALYGLRNHREVRDCLAQYDTLRWPESGPSYVGYFLSEAVERGWRLADQHALIWGVFREYQKAHKINSWGMQYFTAAINSLLTDFLPQYGTDHLDEDMVRACIDVSGLIPSLFEVLT